MPRGSDLIAAINAQDVSALDEVLETLDGSIPSRAVIDASRLAWKAGLVRLKKHRGDGVRVLNASYRSYRPLHALIQEHPHKGGSSTAKRAACLEWMPANGADPTAALPSALWRQDYDTAERLLARGASIDRAIDEGRPLLNNLIRWGQFKPAMWLLDKGASVTREDARGWTALDQARSRGNRRMLDAVVARSRKRPA